MEMTVLEDLFLREIAELYGAEQQIVKALPKMAKAAGCHVLRDAFDTHRNQTEHQVERLEKIYKAIGRKAEAQESPVVTRLIARGEEIIASKGDPAVMDAALISAAQQVEHFEISAYGSARSHAKTLGYSKIAALLEETLREEERTDVLLTQLADKTVNGKAARAPFADARFEPRGGEEAGGWGFSALLAGICIGAAVALLYAPKSGNDLRNGLKDTADQWRGTAEDLIERGRQTIGEQRSRLSRV